MTKVQDGEVEWHVKFLQYGSQSVLHFVAYSTWWVQKRSEYIYGEKIRPVSYMTIYCWCDFYICHGLAMSTYAIIPVDP